MLYMNDGEIAEARCRFSTGATPHLQAAVSILARLQEWTDAHSDGWAYWPKPCRAAKALMTLIKGVDHGRPQDVTTAAVRKACQPIRAFLTRQGVDHRLIIDLEEDESSCRAIP